MKFTTLLLCTLYSYVSFAQKCDSSLQLINHSSTISGIYNPIWDYNNSLHSTTITAFGDIYTGSNSITTNFLKNIYNNGFIDSSLKNTVSSNLESINRVGVITFGGLGFTYSKPDWEGRFAITGGIEHNIEQTADFTPDVFHLIFYGNYDLQDSIAVLDNTSFTGIKYNKYRIGIVKPFQKSDGVITTAFMLNLVQGQSTNLINVKSAAFYTAPFGEYIDFTYDFTVRSTEKDSSFFDWQGTGAAADVFFEYNWTKIGLKFSFIANDLGFVNWNGGKKLTADTSIHFEGVEVNDLLNATSSVFTADTIYELLGLHKTDEPFTAVLPVKLNAGFVKEFSPTFYTALGIQHIFNETYTPLVYLKAGKMFPSTGTAADVMAEYGGYGGLNFGLGLTQRITSHASIQLNASNFLGLIVPDKLTGAAAYIMLHAAF